MADISGCHVRLRVAGQEPIEGDVFACDSAQVILTHPSEVAPGRLDVRVIRAPFITDIEVLSTPPGGERNAQNSALAPVDMQKLLHREHKTIQAELDAQKLVGKKVPKGAQEIFDGLFKTMPTAWEDDTIVVLDKVRVEKPYIKAYTQSKEAGAAALCERVQTVLDGERKKLGLSETDGAIYKRET